MENTWKAKKEDVLFTSLQAQRVRLAAQLEVVEEIIRGWHTHIMHKDITTLTTIGLLPLGTSLGRPNYDVMERTQLRLINRIGEIDELIRGDHGLSKAEFMARVERIQNNITIRPVDITESSFTPDP